ncbi:MAG: hypothetical protein IJE04_04090 [Bacilli bacterium]|nr:hypothetical protein [Bacilli bacterium]
MRKEENLNKLKYLRHILIDYLFETIDDNKHIKEYFDKYLFYSTFEIDTYEKIGDFEYVQFDLAAQNTGNIFKYRYDIKNDEYKLIDNPVIYSAKVDNFEIKKEILKEIFDIARENKELLAAEKVLTKKLIKLESIS